MVTCAGAVSSRHGLPTIHQARQAAAEAYERILQATEDELSLVRASAPENKRVHIELQDQMTSFLASKATVDS